MTWSHLLLFEVPSLCFYFFVTSLLLHYLLIHLFLPYLLSFCLALRCLIIKPNIFLSIHKFYSFSPSYLLSSYLRPALFPPFSSSLVLSLSPYLTLPHPHFLSLPTSFSLYSLSPSLFTFFYDGVGSGWSDDVPSCAFAMWARQSAMYVRAAKVESDTIMEG